MPGNRNEVVLYDQQQRRWLYFQNPRCILHTTGLEEVLPMLKEISARTGADGLYAAGFLAYEVAPAFDSALRVNNGGTFPLLWFGLYEAPEIITPLSDESSVHDMPMGWQPSVSLAEYRNAIRRIKEFIAAGRTYQVNYSIRMLSPFDGDPWAYFLQLVDAQEATCAAYVDTGRYAVCSASPELFFHLQNGRLTARPMKGTARRGLTWAEDCGQAAWLHHSEKNRAENVMIVDMVRNDMGRVAQIGSITVPQLFAVEKYPSVWQMTSTVTARTNRSVPDVIQALFPCASVTGAPKASTMNIIADLEQTPRRIYTGSIGYITPQGNAQFNVAIRTVLVDRQCETAEYGVGGGVVWDSTEDGEWEECVTKARILTMKRPSFCLLETILWTRQDGYALLEQHVERLSRSADYFDFSLDAAAVLRRLEEVAENRSLETRRLTDAYRVRLLAARDGAISLQTAPISLEGAPEPRSVCLAPMPVDSSDPFLYHKTTNRALYEKMQAACPGFDDVILWNERGEITESCIANVVVELDGERVTPPVSCGLLAGTYREWMLQQGLIGEKVVLKDDLPRCTGLWLVNSVRGVVGAKRVGDNVYTV